MTDHRPSDFSLAGLRVFLIANMCTWIITVTAIVWRHAVGQVEAWRFFIDPIESFADFKVFNGLFQVFHRTSFFDPALNCSAKDAAWAYPATATAIYRPFYLLGVHGLRYFLLLNFVMTFVIFSLFAVTLGRRGASASQAWVLCICALLLSFPFWFVFHQANIEICLWYFIAAGIFAYWRRCWPVAATLFGFAAAIKIYPLTLLGLLFAARRYGAFAWGVLIAIAMDYTATLWVGPSYSVAKQGIKRGILCMQNVMAARDPFVEAYDHSLFSVVKLMATSSASNFDLYLKVYTALVPVLGVALYFQALRKAPRANQVCALLIFLVLAPPLSYEYTLIHMLICLAILLLVQNCARLNRQLFVLLGLICGNLNFIAWHGTTYGGQVKCVLLVALLVEVLRHPLHKESLHSVRSPGTGSGIERTA